MLLNDLIERTVLALFEDFAHAEDGSETIFESDFGLSQELLIIFSEILTAFAVAEDYILSAGRLHHSGTNLTGVSTLSMFGAVFSAEFHEFRFEHGVHGSKVSERHTHDYLAISLLLLKESIDIISEFDTLIESSVHFPVAGNNVFSHIFTN